MNSETFAALLKERSWIPMAILVIPMLDNLIAEGRWPYGWVQTPRTRLLLILLGGAVVSALAAVQEGSTVASAFAAGAFTLVFTCLKNGATLFPVTAPPVARAAEDGFGPDEPPTRPDRVSKTAAPAPSDSGATVTPIRKA